MTLRLALLATLLVAPVAPLGGQAPTRQVGQTDDYHGHIVADPYRWLEDGDSPAVAEWIKGENAATAAYLSDVPQREAIRRRLTALWNYERFSLPFARGDRYFYSRNDGLQNQAVLWTHRGLRGRPRPLLDPNTLSSDGTVALAGTVPSHDGRLLAYGVAQAGSDWVEYRVRDVESGRDRPDTLRWIKFSSVSWSHDGQGFFYSRYPEPTGAALREANRNHTLYYHRLGTAQAADRLIYQRPDQPDWLVGASVTDDGRYLVLVLSHGTDRRNRIAYIDLGDARHPRLDGRVVPLLDAFDASYDFIGNDGTVFYFRTDRDAPRSKLVAVDLRHPEPSGWRTLVPETGEVLEGATLVGETFIARYLHDATSRLVLLGLDGSVRRTITLPSLGTVPAVSGERDARELFYSFTSFLYPTTIYRFDLAAAAPVVFRQPTVGFDPAPYVTEQVFYRSKDGTRVPMFVTHRRDLKRDGSAPAYLTGYGGFDISILPGFSVSQLVWLELGGLVAVPNLRGGGEYGEAWHQAGMLDRKQNVFDDFVGAAEWLVAEGYTSRSKLSIAGRSNGGLLVGAALTQRPDLFAAAIPEVGVMDMLRFHRFTIGWAWVPEYGSADSAAQFDYLVRYSPLHNLRAGTDYPATLVTTADHDDRVVPAHSFKFAAALQAATAGRRPALIRIETRAGHGAGTPTAKLIDYETDRWAFLVRALDLRPNLP